VLTTLILNYNFNLDAGDNINLFIMFLKILYTFQYVDITYNILLFLKIMY